MKLVYTTLLMIVCANSSANSEIQSLENISQELVEIRHQIAGLHDEINFKKERFRDQIRSYSNQKSDLEVKISRADLNIKDIKRELDKLKESNQQAHKGYDGISPVVKEAISNLRQSVKDSLPFKLEQRLQALDDIEYRLDANIISPNKAANQLWAFVEDELVLGRSNGIYNETVNIDGQKQLVKVLRLGKVAMFFKTSDKDYGLLRRDQGSWVQESVTSSEHVRQLDNLFDSFNKNIRNGLFSVPNILPNS
jgi:hypothetical protein